MKLTTKKKGGMITKTASVIVGDLQQDGLPADRRPALRLTGVRDSPLSAKLCGTCSYSAREWRLDGPHVVRYLVPFHISAPAP